MAIAVSPTIAFGAMLSAIAGGVDDRLERGAGLSLSIDRAVELRCSVIPAADKRADVAVGGSIATTIPCR